jgi:hypothetical protein
MLKAQKALTNAHKNTAEQVDERHLTTIDKALKSLADKRTRSHRHHDLILEEDEDEYMRELHHGDNHMSGEQRQTDEAGQKNLTSRGGHALEEETLLQGRDILLDKNRYLDDGKSTATTVYLDAHSEGTISRQESNFARESEHAFDNNVYEQAQQLRRHGDGVDLNATAQSSSRSALVDGNARSSHEIGNISHTPSKSSRHEQARPGDGGTPLNASLYVSVMSGKASRFDRTGIDRTGSEDYSETHLCEYHIAKRMCV